jgi:hypothetical protein
VQFYEYNELKYTFFELLSCIKICIIFHTIICIKIHTYYNIVIENMQTNPFLEGSFHREGLSKAKIPNVNLTICNI